MTPINSVTTTPFIGHRTVNSVQLEPGTTTPQNLFSAELSTAHSPLSELIDQLPEESARGVFDIFRNLNILALQAAEPGQQIENRENLQIQASNELLGLTELLDQINQDELDLFVALFQNQSINFSSSFGSNSSNLLSSLSPFDVADNSLESLLQFDLRTNQGVLSALDFSSSVLNSLSIFDTGSDFLENFLDDLIDISISSTLLDILTDEEETQDNSTNLNDDSIQEPTPPLTGPNNNPPTIIELAG